MDRLTGGLRPYLLLTLFCLALALPGLVALPPLDRDESRFMQATRQMLETGDYIRIQFQDEMRAKKPAGAYWLQAGSVALLSRPDLPEAWPYRLPSVVAMVAAVLMTFGFGRPLVGARPALLGAGMLAASLILVAEAHQAKTDAVLLALTVLAQGILARFYVLGRARAAAGIEGGCGSGGGGGSVGGRQAPPMPGVAWALLFWLAEGAAILVKGPVVPMVSLLTIAAVGIADRDIRWFNAMKPILGCLVAAAVAGPWFAAISQATGGAFVGEAVKGDLLPKLLGAQESHGGFPGLYLLLSPVLLWPGSLLMVPAAFVLWAQRKRVVYRVLLAWALPTWVVFELVPTKLPHYVLPVFPALALVTAALVMEGAEVFRHRLARLWYGLWLLIGGALAVSVVVLPWRFGIGFQPVQLVAAAAIVLAVVLPAMLAWQGRLREAALGLALTAIVTYPVVLQGVLPGLERINMSRSLARMVETIGSDGPIAAAGYSEPSLVFLLGTATKLTDGAGAAAHLAAHPGALAVVETAQRPAFDAGVVAFGLHVVGFGEVDGFNYSRGKWLHLEVLGVGAP